MRLIKGSVVKIGRDSGTMGYVPYRHVSWKLSYVLCALHIYIYISETYSLALLQRPLGYHFAVATRSFADRGKDLSAKVSRYYATDRT